MLSDPTTITYNSISKTLPRTSGASLGTPRKVAEALYGTADGEFMLRIAQHAHRNGSRRAEIRLSRMQHETDSGTAFDGMYTNAFGLILETNAYSTGASVDIPLLRTSLLAFVDSTLQSRILAGEL